MENIDLNRFLNREKQKETIQNWCKQFELNKSKLDIKRGLYVFGLSGIGKTMFVNAVLKELNYDVINYNAGDVRNKNVIETITKNYMSDVNIISMFKGEKKKMIIVMDEIDGMNSGDKGGINTLIKLIRPKKTKKQKLEETTNCPIICIGSYKIDKKIRELMKVCDLVELEKPSNEQVKQIINEIAPETEEQDSINMIDFVNGDLRKLNNIIKISSSFNLNCIISSKIQESEIETFDEKSDKLSSNSDTIDGSTQTTLSKFLSKININQNTKNTIRYLFNNNIGLNQHNKLISETDRTIIGLLWHENIIDILSKFKKSDSIILYIEILKNICFADYIDRITFQKQIWLFNEMSSIIKSVNNNSLLHSFLENQQKILKLKNSSKKTSKNIFHYCPQEVRFTKVLTKYSTEYNNLTFLQILCLEFMIDKEDLLYLFLYLKITDNEYYITNLLENYDITNLDINRMFRYLEKITSVNHKEEI
jgi:hypothetical protein